MPRARSPSALWFVNAAGNPNVNPEDATTYTAGFVWQPSTGRPLRDGFSGTLDWYEIEIEDMIAVEPGSAVYEACLSPTSNPAFDVNHEACRRIIRNPSTGGATASNVSYINAGGALLSGIDLAANWQADLADMGFQRLPGTFAVNFLVSTLLDLETQATPTSPVIDWKGSLGPDPGTALNNGAFDYRTFTTLSYSFNDWNVSLRWRHLPKAKSALQGALDNLFDTDPVITGARTALDPNPTTGQGTTEAGFYSILGRQLYVGVEAQF